MEFSSCKTTGILQKLEYSAYALGTLVITAVALGALGLFGNSCQQWVHFTLPKAIPVTYWPLLGATPFLVGIAIRQLRAYQPQQREIRPEDIIERYNTENTQFEVYDSQTRQWIPSYGTQLTDEVRKYLERTGGKHYANFENS